MVHPLITMLHRASTMSDLTTSGVMRVMEMSIQEAVCAYFNVEECEVNLHFQTVQPTFHVPSNMLLEEAELFKPNAVYNDFIYPEFTFEMLHDDIIAHCRGLFVRNVQVLREEETFKKWRMQRHGVVNGTIGSVYDDRMTVDLRADGVMGIMQRSQWVQIEIPMYKSGKNLQFFVLRVEKYKSITEVYLSRGSKNFPAALIRTQVSGLKIKVLRRLQGKICWIKSSSLISEDLVKAIKEELRGERLVFVK